MDTPITPIEARIAAALNEIESMFVPGVKITFLARMPGDDNGDLLLTKDDIPEAIKALQRCHERAELRKEAANDPVNDTA